MDSTRELVYKAADDLLSEGIKPSQQLVREKIGRGSATTIHRALNDWWQQLGVRLKQEEQGGSDIPTQVQRSLADLWSTACQQANYQYQQREKAFRQQLEADRAALQEDKSSFADRAQQLSEQLNKAYERVNELQNELDKARLHGLELEKQLFIKTTELEKSSHNNKVLEKVIEELEQRSR